MMAIKVMSLVWEGYPGGGSDLLAMLALADWSDDNGRCYPSMSSIATKTRLSRSQAQRVVHGLIDSGFVQVIGNEAGGAPGATRQYRIVLTKLTGCT
ncbi:TPA: helix-turn-helix domain-containing protein, partial [Escherichia coli]|nr:helix-turn-helix domain-containing protein [Escherichia coli]